jgi:hypothetical protein
MRVDAMNLKDIFRQIQANANDLHDSSPSMQLTAHGNPRREGGVHTIGARGSRVIFGVALVVGAVMSSAYCAENRVRWP